jgi:hypothetical protein
MYCASESAPIREGASIGRSVNIELEFTEMDSKDKLIDRILIFLLLLVMAFPFLSYLQG